MGLIIDAVYSLYLKVNIKILVILNRSITLIATSLAKVKIKLEVRAHSLRIRRGAIEGETLEHKREISKIWFYCPNCGAVGDNSTENCPAGCGFSPLNEVKLKIPHIKILLDKGKIYTTRPYLFLPLIKNKKPPDD